MIIISTSLLIAIAIIFISALIFLSGISYFINIIIYNHQIKHKLEGVHYGCHYKLIKGNLQLIRDKSDLWVFDPFTWEDKNNA